MPKIIYQNKSIFFIHIPKTGGTSLYSNLKRQGAVIEDYDPYTPAFEDVSSHHLDYNQCKKYYKDTNNEFAILRDPWKRTLSEYVYKTKDTSFKKLNNWLFSHLTLYQKNPCVKDNHFKPMTSFIGTNTTLFNFENRDAIHNWICEQLENRFDFSHIQNQSVFYNYIDIDKLLSKEVKELWKDHYYQDLRLYNSLDK